MSFRSSIQGSLLQGVLNLDLIVDLIDEGVVIGADRSDLKEKISKEQNESAIDLRLSDEGWALKSTLKPKSNSESESVRFLVHKYGSKLTGLNEGIVLEKDHVYLFKLQESLNLKDKFRLYAQASGKSSIGRLDILTRLIIDDSPIYDEINKPHRGDLFVEVIPLSFPILVKTGSSVNQLRLFRGKPDECRLSPDLLKEMETPVILDHNGEPKKDGQNQLSIDLSPIQCGGEQACAIVAKQGVPFDAIDISLKNHYDPTKYWERVRPTEDALEMQKDRFYILRSKERFYLPDNIAVRCIAYTEGLGETRIHYAGFAHPWFSRHEDKNKANGAPLIFEVRCHSFPVLARDGEDFARIEFYRMATPTKVINKDYDTQELKLSKCFKDW
jgi:dCTP deaminase